MATAFLPSAIILASGTAHAGVNAILKSGGDKMSSRALIDGFSSLIILPAAFFVAPPDNAWGWLVGSLFTHLVYLVALVRAFEGADMSAAYPLFRGMAPMLASLAAVTLFREPITWPVAAGVAMVSGGVLINALGRQMAGRTLAWSLLCGVSIAVYTVIDAQGVRAAPSAPSYIVWIFLMDGFGIGALFALWRGPVFIAEARRQWRPGLIAGVVSIFSYGGALWAFRLGATPKLAALRETSILFALIIAVVFLKERLGWARLASAGLMAAGAATLVASH